MNEKLKELFELCLKAKEYGADCFFDYSPHVDSISVRVYPTGWNGEEPIKSFSLYTDKENAEEIIDECEDYIKNAILNKED